MSYPRNLAYFLNRLSGYSRNTLQLYPSTPQNSVRSSSLIRILLPPNTIVDMRSFCFNFFGSTNASTGNAGFPKHIETIFDSVSIEVNGETITPATNLTNHVFKFLADYHLRDRQVARGILQNGVSALTDGTDKQGRQFSVDNWVGFLSTCMPSHIDTSILGDVYVVIRLAQPSVLALDATAIAASATADYSITNLNATVDTVSFDDGATYYNFVNELLSHQNLEIPFEYWVSFQSSPTSLPATITATLNTGSLNMLVGTVVNGVTTGSNLEPISTSDYFQRGSPLITSVQTYVNNIQYPQFPVLPYQSYKQTLKALSLNEDVVGQLDDCFQYGGSNAPLGFWQNYAFAHATRFNHPVASDERVISGMDTRGTQGSIRFQINGSGGSNIVPLLLANCTGVLNVGAYRSISVAR